MHPDQSTPPDHHEKSTQSQSEPDVPRKPEISQEAEEDMDTDDDGAPAANPVDRGARVAEAGNAYVGRELDDDLKSSPRVEDGDEAVDEDPTTPGDD